MRRILHFIKYNNAFTIGFVLLFLGSGVTLAANPDAVISKKETVRSIDNTYVIGASLDSYNFGLRVTDITEDDTSYFVTYTYTTIALDNYVWKDTTETKTLNVSKASLNGTDLGLFVAKELGQIIDSQVVYLKEVQKIEKSKGQSKKVVATTYSGLVGRMLSSREEVFDGYTPVIPKKEKEKDNNDQVAAVFDTDLSKRSQSIPKSVQLQREQEQQQKEQQQANKEAELQKRIEELLAQQNSQATTPPSETDTTDTSSGTTTPPPPPADTGSSTPVTPPPPPVNTSTSTSNTGSSTPSISGTTTPVVPPPPPPADTSSSTPVTPPPPPPPAEQTPEPTVTPPPANTSVTPPPSQEQTSQQTTATPPPPPPPPAPAPSTESATAETPAP